MWFSAQIIKQILVDMSSRLTAFPEGKENIIEWTVTELRSFLSERDLPTTGVKAILFERLSNWFDEQVMVEPPAFTDMSIEELNIELKARNLSVR